MTENKAGLRPVIALGTFDGLHPGHRKVILTCVELAHKLASPAAVYTFLENPRSLFGASPKALMTNEEKEKELLALGIDAVYAVHFTGDLASLSPEDFISLLIDTYHPCALVAGEDYSFGKYAAGGSELLGELCREKGIRSVIVPLVRDSGTGEPYSSTRIRDAIARGDRELAEKLLHGFEEDS